MSIVKPFKCVRPTKEYASRVAALPYDVYNRKEAKEVALKEPISFLNIDRPETQFDDSIDMYSEQVYDKARELLDSMISNGIFTTDLDECYYIYEMTMDGRTQTGIVACASIDDYLNNVIKKHENTRADKEIDRIKHVDTCNAQTGPIFLAYRSVDVINQIVDETKESTPIYDFTQEDNVGQRVWRICDADKVAQIKEEFEKIDSIYIADGHHRAASAVKVGIKRREANPGYKGDEEFNFFLSVLFPDNQLMIMDYNRVVKDLNGSTKDEFLDKLETNFNITEKGSKEYKPDKKGKIGMYLEGKWYELEIKEEFKMEGNPVRELDVSLLQEYVITPILGIEDVRTDKRIDFIGGIRGLNEIEKRCNEDMKVGFAMYPTSIEELFAVADADLLMPPKSTWFEPKLKSGLFIHKLD